MLLACTQTFSFAQHQVTSVAYSPDGAMITCAAGMVERWGVDGIFACILEPDDVVSQVCSSSNRTAAGLACGRIWIWDTGTGEHVSSLVGHSRRITCLAYSPCGSRLASASADGTARIWHEAGNCLCLINGPADTSCYIAYSPDGSRLATGFGDGTLAVWGTNNNKYQTGYRVSPAPRAVAFSPVADFMAVAAGNDALLLDIRTDTQVCALQGHTSQINSMSFVRYGHMLVTGSDDCTAKLWSIDGVCLATADGHNHCVMSVAVAPSGHAFATASWDGTTKLWDISMFSPEARVLALVLISRRRLLPHVPQELWRLTLDEFY